MTLRLSRSHAQNHCGVHKDRGLVPILISDVVLLLSSIPLLVLHNDFQFLSINYNF